MLVVVMTFTNMDRFSIAQRVKIIQSYYRNNNSVVSVHRDLRSEYGLHNRPTERTIQKTVNRFEESGSVIDRSAPIHHHPARTHENIGAVSESVAEEPETSIRRRSQQLGIPYSTTHIKSN